MLTGKQKRYLRAIGSTLNPIVQIGKFGINENVLGSLEEALEARELVKIRILHNSPLEPEDVAQELAKIVGAELVQEIGRNLLLYRPSEENPSIRLP